jgi:hypothetical protein
VIVLGKESHEHPTPASIIYKLGTNQITDVNKGNHITTNTEMGTLK